MTEQAQIYTLEEKFKPVTIDTDETIEFLNEINFYNGRYRDGEWILRGHNNVNRCLDSVDICSQEYQCAS